MLKRLLAVATGTASLSLACIQRPVDVGTEDAGGSDGTGTRADASATSSVVTRGDETMDETTGVVTRGDETVGETKTEGGIETMDDGFRLDLARLDVPEEPPFPFPPGECMNPSPENTMFVCDIQPDDTIGYQCAPLPAGGCEQLPISALIASINACFGLECGAPSVHLPLCGPDPSITDACCYWFEIDEVICPGRPFLVDGHERLAARMPRDDWARPVAALRTEHRATREALAQAFAEAGSFEHASVASFSRFTLELLGLGAPAALVAAAVQATREEVEHARLWFGLAARHGLHVGPGPLEVDDCMSTRLDLRDVVVRTIYEGCIAETISAWQAHAAARTAAAPELGAELLRLAEEELRHCELAWAFVRWALDREPGLRPHVAAAFAEAPRHVPRGPALARVLDEPTVRAHGLLPPRDRARLAVEALTTLVAPAARALLRAHDVHGHAAAPEIASARS